MPGRINGFSLAYAAGGGAVLWSGIAGTSISDTFRGLLSGQAPGADTEPTGAAAAEAAEASGSGAAAGGSAAPASEQSWAQSLLSALGAPATAANLSSVEEWIAREGDFSAAGHNNPLNTTLVTSGSTGDFNGAGVQNYGTEAEGIAATVKTLESGAYSDILLLLRGGTGLASGAAAGLEKWSGGAYSSV